jgi:hypothetical protein
MLEKRMLRTRRQLPKDAAQPRVAHRMPATLPVLKFQLDAEVARF